jgi:hypothetical protein
VILWLAVVVDRDRPNFRYQGRERESAEKPLVAEGKDENNSNNVMIGMDQTNRSDMMVVLWCMIVLLLLIRVLIMSKSQRFKIPLVALRLFTIDCLSLLLLWNEEAMFARE